MKRRDWLLVCVGEHIEPIQLQKTLFKFAMESGAETNELYSFNPYNWGPCSFDIYDDLKSLRGDGLIGAVPSGRGWNQYAQTAMGKGKDQELRYIADPEVLQHLDRVRGFVTERSFDELLRDVYSQYPEYATKSFFDR